MEWCSVFVLLPADPPCLDEFPVDVDGVVEMQEQPFAAIEKTEAENVVVEKGGSGIKQGVAEKGGPGTAGATALNEQFGNLGAVAVHVLEIDDHVGIGVVKHVVLQFAAWAAELRSAVRADALAEACGAALEEAEFVVGIKTAMAHPAAKDQIEAGNPVRIVLRFAVLTAEQILNLFLQPGSEWLIGILEENPLACAEVESDVLLLTVAAKGVIRGFGTEGLRNFQSAISGTGIYNNNFIGPANGFEGANEIRFLVHGDHGNGQSLTHRGQYIAGSGGCGVSDVRGVSVAGGVGRESRNSGLAGGC